jgi:hypothetical protein
LAGLLADWARHGIDLKFLDDVSKTLDVGKAAVVAEIEQSWVSPLEQQLTQQGGTVFRRFRTDLVDDQLLCEERALQKALEALEDELEKDGGRLRSPFKKKRRGREAAAQRYTGAGKSGHRTEE